MVSSRYVNQSIESKKMAKLTITKCFGRVVKIKYNRQVPNFLKIKKFLIDNELQKVTVKSVLEQLKNKWDMISIKKKATRAKNGDLIEFVDLKQLKKANLEKSIVKPSIEQAIDKDIQVLRCQFVKMDYLNTIDDEKSLIVRLQNGETRELVGSQYSINSLPTKELIKSKNENHQLIIHYKNKREWAIEPPTAMDLIMKSIENN